MNDDKNLDDNRRRNNFLRLFLENLGGLLSLLAVVVYGGSAIERLNAVERDTSQITAIRLDVMGIKSRVDFHEKEIERLERERRAIRDNARER